MPSPNLSAVLSNPDSRRALIRDAGTMLDDEVASRGGITGLGIKAAFTMVKAIRPGIIEEVLEGLMPEFAKALDPVLAQRPQGSGPGVAAFLEARTNDVVQALLGVTDARARKTTHKSLLAGYQKLRPIAEKQVAQSVPRLARLVEKHLT
jgi:hypothetical protein